MYIEHLSLSNFRNYARLELGLPTNNPVVLHGQNAQGKTSLLEAIYYLATAKSPYNAADRQLIHWRAENDPIPFARLSAEICSQHAPMNRLEMTLMIERTVDGVARLRKVIKVNGVDKRVMDIVGLLNVVLFLPHDLSLVEGSPSDRRRFMDNTLGQVDAAYLNAIDTYEKILPQRNALLKRINDRQASPNELRFWDDQLVAALGLHPTADDLFRRARPFLLRRNRIVLGRVEEVDPGFQRPVEDTVGGLLVGLGAEGHGPHADG